MNDNTNHPAVEFQDVSLAFDGKVLLDRISFTIPRGEMRILIGPSKSGKSTILKLAIGLLKPDSGRILLDGRDITVVPEEELFALREQTGVVLQSDALFSMNVAENVSYRLTQQGFDEAEIEKEVQRVLHEVGLDETEGLMPDELSGGMSRRASVARALAGSPKIMFYDSPCSGLDPITSRRVLNEIIRLRDQMGVSSLYITQTLDEVRYLCSRIYDADGAEGTMLRKEGDEFCVSNTRLMMLSHGTFLYEGTDEGFWTNENEEIREFMA